MESEKATQKEIIATLWQYLTELRAAREIREQEIDKLDSERGELIEKRKEHYANGESADEISKKIVSLYKQSETRRILKNELCDFISATRAAWLAETANAVGEIFIDELNKFAGKNIGPKTSEKIRATVAARVSAELEIEIRCWWYKETYSRLKLCFSCNREPNEIYIGSYTDDIKKDKITFEPIKNLTRTPEQIAERVKKIKEAGKEFFAVYERFSELKNKWKDYVDLPNEKGGMFLNIGRLDRPQEMAH